MTPILYKSDEIDFLNNGLGQLNELYSVDIQEQRNGVLTFTGSYPVTGQHYADIQEGRIILAKPSPLDDNHAFRIVNTQLDIAGHSLLIEADSITYDLTKNIVKSVTLKGTGSAAMVQLQSAIVNPSIFTLYSDITTSSTSTLNYVNPMEAIAGTQGSFLQYWGGEMKRENRRVAMFNRRGRDNVATFRLGKNINGLRYTVNMANLVTVVIPTVNLTEGDSTRYLEGATVSSKRVGNYPIKYTQSIDVTDKITIKDGDTDKVIIDRINAYASDWFTKPENTAKDLPDVTIEIDVLSLQDSADYADRFAKLETIGLTDTVTVYVPEYGVNVTAIVNELHYDPIGERVTNMVVGTAKVSFVEVNQNALSDLQDKVTKVQEQATQAVVSADGKSSNRYGRNEPEHPQEGDTWFWNDGTDSGIRIFTNGDWVDSADTKTFERINNAVDGAIETSKTYTDELNEKQVQNTNALNDKVDKSVKELTDSQQAISSQATTYTDSAVASQASQTASIASDVTSKANQYASQAKSEAIAAATSADGVVKTEFKKTTDSMTATIQQTKSDADSGISKAQTTATQALNGLSTKVERTEYNQKTGELSSKINETSDTAEQSKQDIIDIKETNSKQDNRMLEIEKDAKGIKQTVSDLSTEQGKQSGYISTLQQQAEGFEATVTKVNNLSVGGRNLLFGTSTGFTGTGNNSINGTFNDQGGVYYLAGNKKVLDLYNQYGPSGYLTISFDWVATGDTISGQFNPQWNDSPWGGLSQSGVIKPSATNKSGHYESAVQLNFNGYSTGTGTGIRFRQDNLQGNVTISNLKIEAGNVATDWSPAPEDVDTKLAQVKLTADGVYQTVNDPQTGLNTRVSTAEGNITKVQSSVNGMSNTVTQTANGLTQEIADRKTGDSNTLQAGKDFTTSQIKNYDSGVQSQITQASNAIMASVSGVNLFTFSRFEDSGNNKWPGARQTSGTITKWGYFDSGNNGISVTSTAAWQGFWHSNIPVSPGQVLSASVMMNNNGRNDDAGRLDIWFVDKSGNRVSMGGDAGIGSASGWVMAKIENMTVPSGVAYMQVSLVNRIAAGPTHYALPMVNVGSKALPYTPDVAGQTALQLFKDNFLLGIQSNTGALISGINGDSSGLNIVGKKITISGDTTFIGNNFMDGAIIKNASIGGAQIAKASITDANILNLNVDKLSGNVANFIRTYWDGQYGSTSITSAGMTVQSGATTTTFDSLGAHFAQGALQSDYAYGLWRDDKGNNTSSSGIYLGTRGNANSFTNIVGPDGGSALLIAGNNMDYGSNNNIVKGYANIFANVNVRGRLDFKGSRWNSPTYIEADENRRTLNFYTALGNTGNDGNYFWFSQNVLSNGVFSSASQLSKKNVKSAYEEDALGEIAKTQLVNFEYKNRAGQTHVSPIIDDVNSEKEYYIPETILGQNGEYVDMYSMISMAWKAIQQLNEKIG